MPVPCLTACPATKAHLRATARLVSLLATLFLLSEEPLLGACLSKQSSLRLGKLFAVPLFLFYLMRCQPDTAKRLLFKGKF